jgi:LPS export ABC transporter permease LptF
MRAPRTIVAYLLREVAIYTALGLTAILVVLVTRNLVRTIGELVNAGFSASDLLLIVRLLGTMLVVYALPIAFLFGVLLAIGRMAADVEITAMRACGIGLRTFTVPIVVAGLLLSGLTLRFTLEAEPAARRDMRDAIKTILARGGVIEPGRFRHFGPDRLVYVEERNEGGRLREILISDRSNPERPFIVFARSGRITLDEEAGELVLELIAGDVHLQVTSKEQRYQRIAFDRFAYGVDVAGLLEKGRLRKPKEMTMAELGAVVERIRRGDTDDLRETPVEYALQWHRRIAGPLAPTLFGLVGVPIAMRRTRGARSMGMFWCAALAFGYYVLQKFCEMLAVEGGLSPVLASWAPNLCFASLGIVLLVRARRAGI